jgi:hypothetical protein
MAHRRGAFKVIPASIAGAVKKAAGNREIARRPDARLSVQTAKFRAINLAKLVSLPKK